ncbi:prefoldin subunit [Cooperia oncophora]
MSLYYSQYSGLFYCFVHSRYISIFSQQFGSSFHLADALAQFDPPCTLGDYLNSRQPLADQQNKAKVIVALLRHQLIMQLHRFCYIVPPFSDAKLPRAGHHCPDTLKLLKLQMSIAACDTLGEEFKPIVSDLCGSMLNTQSFCHVERKLNLFLRMSAYMHGLHHIEDMVYRLNVSSGCRWCLYCQTPRRCGKDSARREMSRKEDVSIERFRTVVSEDLLNQLREAQNSRQEILRELQEYASLLVVVRNMKNKKAEKINIRASLGHQVFVNAELDKKDTVIVKLGGDLFAELKLERAEIFVTEKLDVLRKKADLCLELASKIEATMKFIMATVASHAMVASNHIKESAVRSLITIGCRGKVKPKSIDPNTIRLMTALTNALATVILFTRTRRNLDRCRAPTPIK